MQAAQRNDRTWRLPRPMLEDHLVLAALAWVATVVVTFGIVIVVSRFRDISISGWEIASGIAQWYVGIISGWITFTMLPLFVANGRTRRDSFVDWGIIAGALVVLVSILISIGYLLEKVFYSIGDWPLNIDGDHLFSSHTDIGMILLEYLLAFIVWATVGGFIGAALFRFPDAGWLSLIPGVLLLGLTGLFDRSEIGLFGFVTRNVPALDVTSPAGAILVSLISAAIAFGLAWFVVRDMPLRNK